MGIFNILKSKVQKIGKSVCNEYKKFANSNLMEGTLAGCALVINANGIAKPEEKRKMISYIQNSEELKVYDFDTVVSTFEKYFSSFSFDYQIAKGEILKVISKIKDPIEGQLLVRVLISIGAADGDFDQNEKECVKDIIKILNLKCDDFDL